jgi:hypothetical protein
MPFQLFGYLPSDVNFISPSGLVLANGINVKPIVNRSYRNNDTFTLEEYFMFTGTREG